MDQQSFRQGLIGEMEQWQSRRTTLIKYHYLIPDKLHKQTGKCIQEFEAQATVT